MGIERIAMLKYGIPDLRTFYESDLRWLRHYGFLPLDVPSLAGGARDEDDARLAQDPSRNRGLARRDRRDAWSCAGSRSKASRTAPSSLRALPASPAWSRPSRHPNADKLQLCLVDTGTEKVEVVCGAPNARAGMLGVFAPAGIGHSAQRHGAEGEHDPRRHIERHAVLGL